MTRSSKEDLIEFIRSFVGVLTDDDIRRLHSMTRKQLFLVEDLLSRSDPDAHAIDGELTPKVKP